MTALDDRTPAPQPAAAPQPARARTRTPRPGPHLRLERTLLRDGARLVAGMDEVGRGSLAGPVSVGVVVVDVGTRSAPQGVADSKLLTPGARTALLPRLRRWGLARAVGHASAAEIDEIGIIAALRLAGTRALTAACASTGPVDVVVLDGSHDWLTPPAQGGLFDLDTALDTALDVPLGAALGAAPRVHLKVKADRTCASVAAASVLAKCERDAMMVGLAAEHPRYRWDENKGYASPDHLAALRELGPCVLHRRSWRLTGSRADAAPDGAGPVALETLAAPSLLAADDDAAARVDAGAATWGMMGT